jgi:MFS family permease
MSATRGDYVPGTSRLVEEESSSHSLMNGQIILTPPPTRSPNDPLNWPIARKALHCLLVCFVTGFTAATANDAASAQTGMNADLGISYNTMNTGAGVLFIGIGYFTLLISPAAWLYGRRITYLICITLGLVGAVWMARVQGAEDTIWNQLFVGASESCAEANVQLSLSDLFFEHQRGTVLGIYVLATSIGTFLGPLIGGYIADLQGWRWVGWWAVIISGGTLIALYFGLEETAFDRPAYRTSDGVSSYQTLDITAPAEKSIQDSKAAIGDGTGDAKNAVATTARDASETGLANEKPKTYFQRIRLLTPAPNLIGTGFTQYITRLVHTLQVFSFPAVIYSGIQWGSQDAWLTFYLTVEDTTW